MLVRLGAADSVLAGQRIVRAHSPRPRGVPARAALPSGARPAEPEGAYDAEPAYVQDGPAPDVAAARYAQHALAAYQAAELIQPRPGLIIHVQA
jgi:hypothetical protein